MEAIPANLGNGKRWYFICPHTRKRCMKLIAPNNEKYFLHRSAFGLLYKKQTISKSDKAMHIFFDILGEVDELEEEINKPYRKTHYRGKPTPLQKKIYSCYRIIKANRDIDIKSFF